MLARAKMALLTLFSVLAFPALAGTAQVTGTVTYRERIALPPEAMLQVQLLDVSLQDASATVLSETNVALSGIPARFNLPYDPADIDPNRDYAVQARIALDGTSMFINTSRYAVLTNGAGSHVDMVLERMVASQTSLADTEWTVEMLGGQAVEMDRLPTLSFGSGGELAVFGGCNRFAGQFDSADGELHFADNMAGTLMACPPEIETVERRLLDALQSADRFESNGRQLVISGRDGFALIRARAGQQ